MMNKIHVWIIGTIKLISYLGFNFMIAIQDSFIALITISQKQEKKFLSTMYDLNFKW